MRENKKECLYYLRKIAFSETFEECCGNVSSLKDSDIYGMMQCQKDYEIG